MKPIVQIALDTKSIDRALKLGHIAVEAGADWIEAGTSLINFEGVKAIEALAKEFPEHDIVADYKNMDGVKKYFVTAGKLGAKVATVCGATSDASIQQAVKGAREAGIKVVVDLMAVDDLVERGKEVEAMGADYVMPHWGADQRNYYPEIDPLSGVEELINNVEIPVAYATYDLEESLRAVKMGVDVIIQGEPLLSCDDPKTALTDFITKTKAARK